MQALDPAVKLDNPVMALREVPDAEKKIASLMTVAELPPVTMLHRQVYESGDGHDVPLAVGSGATGTPVPKRHSLSWPLSVNFA